MCKADEKEWNDYWRLKRTQAFLRELESDTGIPVSLLVQSVKGAADASPHECRGCGMWIPLAWERAGAALNGLRGVRPL
jgi:hypothetical protein